MPEIRTKRLAAILFADIVGYTRLMQEDEGTAKEQLEKFRRVLNEQVSGFNGQVVHFYGDGCLAIFENPVAASRAATAIQQAFATAPTVPVRIGLHAGTVNVDQDYVYGDAVNITSRIESLGIPGSILLSKKVRDELKNQPDFLIVSLGQFAFKNVEEPTEVFALANEGLFVPKRTEIRGKLKSKRRRSLPMLLLVSAVVLLFTGWSYWNRRSNLALLPKEIVEANEKGKDLFDKSIAVLPFTSMSEGEGNHHFADGIHDDLLTHLSKMGNMKVISRTSVNKYRDTQKTSVEIGRELGVSNLLEGSVRRSGQQVRVNVQLIEAATESLQWSETYDRELSIDNIFAIQSEIAAEIAEILQTTISPVLLESLAEPPTDNLEAYEAFLKARGLIEIRSAPALLEAKSLLEKTIELDPDFALAYVHLGSVHVHMVEYMDSDTERQFEIAWQYLTWGMELNDHLAEAYALKGLLEFRMNADYQEASRAFEKAISINPNYGTAYHWYALAVRYLGRDFEKTLTIHENSLHLNPLSPVIINNYADYLLQTGRHQEALATFRKAIQIEPAFPFIWKLSCRAYSNHLGRLDSAAIQGLKGLRINGARSIYLDSYAVALQDLNLKNELDHIFQEADLSVRQNNLIFIVHQRERAFIEGDYNKAIAFDRQLKIFDRAYTNRGLGYFYSGLDFHYGTLVEFAAYYHDREFEKAIQNYEKQLPDLEEGDFFEPFNLAALNAFQTYIYCLKKTGQSQKADKLWGKYGKIVTTHPVDKDEFKREYQLRELFQVREKLMNGHTGKALEQLEAYFSSGYLTRWQLVQSDPVFDDVRTNPEFIRIMNELNSKVKKQITAFTEYLNLEHSTN